MSLLGSFQRPYLEIQAASLPPSPTLSGVPSRSSYFTSKNLENDTLELATTANSSVFELFNMPQKRTTTRFGALFGALFLQGYADTPVHLNIKLLRPSF
jgi:hypothetical protein